MCGGQTAVAARGRFWPYGLRSAPTARCTLSSTPTLRSAHEAQQLQLARPQRSSTRLQPHTGEVGTSHRCRSHTVQSHLAHCTPTPPLAVRVQCAAADCAAEARLITRVESPSSRRTAQRAVVGMAAAPHSLDSTAPRQRTHIHTHTHTRTRSHRDAYAAALHGRLTGRPTQPCLA